MNSMARSAVCTMQRTAHLAVGLATSARCAVGSIKLMCASKVLQSRSGDTLAPFRDPLWRNRLNASMIRIELNLYFYFAILLLHVVETIDSIIYVLWTCMSAQ